MNFSTLFAGGAIVGLLTTGWNHIKGFGWKMLNYLIVHVYIDHHFRTTLLGHLLKKYKKSPVHDHFYNIKVEYQKNEQITFRGLVPYERFAADLVFWQDWFPIFFSKEDGTNKMTCVSFIRGTIDFDKISKEAHESRNNVLIEKRKQESSKNSRYHIHHVPDITSSPSKSGKTVDADDNDDPLGLPWYQCDSRRLLYHKREGLGSIRSSGNSQLDNLIFPSHVTQLQEEIKLWVNSEEIYAKMGLPWKRGWLLYGPPGTGKTALTRAFAEKYDLPLYSYNLARLNNESLTSAWSAMQSATPCIALFEDFDNVFHLRKNITTGVMSENTAFGNQDGEPDAAKANKMGMFMGRDLLTFDCFLNCLDGVEVTNGVFTIITTNDLTKIDPALGQPTNSPEANDTISSRPGRIDKVIELTFMKVPEKIRMAKRILGDYPDKLHDMLKFVEDYPDMIETPAQFQERCGQIALRAFWEDENALEKVSAKMFEKKGKGSSGPAKRFASLGSSSYDD